MAVLSDDDRKRVHQRWMEDLGQEGEAYDLLKADSRAAVDALDTWYNANATSANTAIPQPARGVLTSKQKAKLSLYIIRARYDVE